MRAAGGVTAAANDARKVCRARQGCARRARANLAAVTVVSPALAASAAAAAQQAATNAAVTVRLLADRDECAAGSALLAQIWGTAPESAPFTGDVLTSLTHAGACVLGAFDRARMVGLTVGLAGPPWSDALYSMIAGVATGQAGRGIGLALKLGQRAWALEHEATSIVWTFDPLIRRNAHFNLTRLGARAGEYLLDFYPPMHDALNRADLTDRLVAEWDLLAPRRTFQPPQATLVLASGAGSEPVVAPLDDRPWLVGTPSDIEGIRRSDPVLARRWRICIRAVMQSARGSGHLITGFTGDGAYVLERTS